MEAPEPRRDADFSRAVLEDLYYYPKKRKGVAWTLWALTGLFGGHRFCLGRPATALAFMPPSRGMCFWSGAIARCGFSRALPSPPSILAQRSEV
ncbi:TM2 domain-containing protein [Congregibacter sp.]|uniref:TM2 domain-containing protein n=1 Tax=Congregibacter sp. TaxID=2744308 RepID=UPI003F6D5159